MKKIICALILLVAWTSPLLAENYNSPFGFSIDIPSHWLILTKQELQDNPDLLNFEGDEFKDTNRDVLNQVKNMVAAGQTEIYINKKTSTISFNDTINVMKAIGSLPKTVDELNQVCEVLPKELSKYYGKPTKVYKCELRTVAEFNSLYSVFDGVVDGTKCIQYQIQKSPSVVLIITAGTKNETFEIINKEFEEMMSSVIIY
jgi:hypothetical protein